LNLKPGDIVVESGTGSGSLSSSIRNAITPGGHLYTFEFNEDRVNKNKETFDKLKFDNVTVLWRDAYSDGFAPKETDKYALKEADAIFLDLPKPWVALSHATNVLKSGGRICCFSPCIEQVQKTYTELAKQNYIEMRCFECVIRYYEKKKNNFKTVTDENLIKKRKFVEITPEQVNGGKEKKTKEFYFSTGPQFTQGHTGFLTFAVKQ